MQRQMQCAVVVVALLGAVAVAASAFAAELQHSGDEAFPSPSPDARARAYYDAVVVEAEGRAEGAGGAGGALPQPLDAATCALPPEQGPCRGYFSFFHYDAPAARCRSFTYSGCGGNANRFRSQKACEAACGHLGLPSDKDKQDKQEKQRKRAPLGDDTESPAPAPARPDCSWGHAPACPAGCYVVNDAHTDCPRCECSQGN